MIEQKQCFGTRLWIYRINTRHKYVHLSTTNIKFGPSFVKLYEVPNGVLVPATIEEVSRVHMLIHGPLCM